MGFELITSANTSAMLYQLSYEATHWEQGQFIEFITPVWRDIMQGCCLTGARAPGAPKL